MYANAGYLHNSLVDFKDKSRPLVVGSCGTYRLMTRPKLPTWRPRGRLDYQILYIAAGKGHFFLDGEDVVVPAGHMVLYHPKEMQKYVYYGSDQTEVFWVHFTGSEVKKILKEYHIPLSGHVFYTGNSPEYQKVFRRMIKELQLCGPHYEEFLTMLLHQLFIIMDRQINSTHQLSSRVQQELDQAIQYFTEHYNEDINIEAYAATLHKSAGWFIRSFRLYTGVTPMQYIISVRIAHAQSLLQSSEYNITEIAAMVGYENPLYFSRLFKRQTGIAPSDYKKHV